MVQTVVVRSGSSSSEKQLNMMRRISVSADGAYDSNSNFRYLEEKGIKPGIKVRKNSIISSRNICLRNKEVIQQTKDPSKWKKKRKYGHRWMDG